MPSGSLPRPWPGRADHHRRPDLRGQLFHHIGGLQPAFIDQLLPHQHGEQGLAIMPAAQHHQQVGVGVLQAEGQVLHAWCVQVHLLRQQAGAVHGSGIVQDVLLSAATRSFAACSTSFSSAVLRESNCSTAVTGSCGCSTGP